MTRPRRRSAAAAVPLVLALAVSLGACGQARPGVAATVGEDSFTVREVNTLTSEFCDAVRTRVQEEQQVFPMEAVRSTVLTSLTMRSLAEQVAEQYGVQVGGADLAAAETQLRSQAREVPESLQETFTQVFGAPVYVQVAVQQVGEQLMAREGTDPGQDPRQTAQQRGREAMLAWAQQHDVRIDPRYGLAMTENGVDLANTQTSLPVSQFADDTRPGRAGPAAAGALPDAQKCG